jgi:LysM repeat protein
MEESMSKKLHLTLALALAAVFVLSACDRSLTSSPIATPTKGVVSTPQNVGGGATQDLTGMGNTFATWTAQAASGTVAAPATPTGTAVPGGTAITPQASATPTGLVPGTGVPTTPVTPVATATRPASYTLKAGEYPYCIARRFNVNPTELLTLNNLISGDLFQPGLVLTIPQTGNPFPSPRYLVPHPTTYVVRVDDTIYKIGCYFGDVDPLAIAARNNLVSPYTLTVGQSINIP